VSYIVSLGRYREVMSAALGLAISSRIVTPFQANARSASEMNHQCASLYSASRIDLPSITHASSIDRFPERVGFAMRSELPPPKRLAYPSFFSFSRYFAFHRACTTYAYVFTRPTTFRLSESRTVYAHNSRVSGDFGYTDIKVGLPRSGARPW